MVSRRNTLENVYIRHASYDSRTLKPLIDELLDATGGEDIKPGMRVLIKPNMLAPSKPEQAITTHPAIIRAVAEYALNKGASVQVGDSIAMGTFRKAADTCGITDALQGLPLTLAPLTDSVPVKTDGKFSTLQLAREALEADIVINLPKLKTHSQMGMTLAVKNLFGCVVGFRKPEWHFRVGENKELFAELLVAIYKSIKPQINIMDAILAMEGLGPGTNGTPKELGYVLASRNAIALDMAACKLVGMPPMHLMTTAHANAAGMLDGETEIIGQYVVKDNFDIPDTQDLLFGPSFVRGFLRRHVATRPVNLPESCKYCGECAKICPAKAITVKKQSLSFDYDKCIRCYCCVEVCPHRAMDKRETWVKKLVRAVVTRGR